LRGNDGGQLRDARPARLGDDLDLPVAGGPSGRTAAVWPRPVCRGRIAILPTAGSRDSGLACL